MPKKRILLFICSVATFFSFAQVAPDWVNPILRQQNYLNQDYYIGFVSHSYQKDESPDEFSEKVRAAARVALSESIFVTIKSKSVSELSNRNGDSEDRYQKSTVTSSSLEAFGMKLEEYQDEKKRVIYAFAYVKRKSLIKHYYSLLSGEMKRIEASLARAKVLEDQAEAYLRFNEELNALNQVKEYQDMLKYLNITSEVVLMKNKWKRFNDETLSALDKIRSTKDVGIRQASYFLVDKLKEELGDEIKTLNLGLITFKSSGIATEFSDYFGSIFRHALEERRGSISRSFQKDGYVVSGNYWPGEKEMQVIANVNYVKDGEIISLKAGASVAIDIGKVNRLGVNYLLINDDELSKNNQMRPTSPVGGLVANLTTQKGSQSVIFKKGEILQLSVSVSRPSYVRIINVWSDNKKFLLADNFYVDQTQTNQSVTLPLEWETDCPCGVEYIQMIAQDHPFEPLEVNKWYGFDLIGAPLSNVLEQMRSMKVQSEYYSESTLVVTTLEE